MDEKAVMLVAEKIKSAYTVGEMKSVALEIATILGLDQKAVCLALQKVDEVMRKYPTDKIMPILNMVKLFFDFLGKIVPWLAGASLVIGFFLLIIPIVDGPTMLALIDALRDVVCAGT